MHTQIIYAVIDYAQVGKHILHFRTVKEPGTADDPVRDTVAFQRKFQGVGLGVGAVKNSMIFKVVFLGNDSGCNVIRFGALIGSFINRYTVTVRICSPKLLPFPTDIVCNNRIGSIKN